MFVVQILGVGLLTCILSWLGLYLFICVANDVLVASLMSLAATRIVLKMQFISFDAGIMLFDSICVLLVSLFSVVVPMIGLRNIKPINIIKAKE